MLCALDGPLVAVLFERNLAIRRNYRRSILLQRSGINLGGENRQGGNKKEEQ
jgi:hypothetical protein